MVTHNAQCIIMHWIFHHDPSYGRRLEPAVRCAMVLVGKTRNLLADKHEGRGALHTKTHKL